MTLDVNQTEAQEPQSINLLADIYEGMRARVYRFDDTQALIGLGFGDATGAVVIRPWTWNESKPIDARYEGAVDTVNAERVNAWLSERPSASADMDFASLLLWSCRRSSLWHRHIVDNGYEEDAQRVGPRVFNRFLIREVLQTWVQMSVRPQDVVRIEAIHATTPTLRLSCGGTRALVAALIEEVEAGDDPLLTDWPGDAFGAIGEGRC